MAQLTQALELKGRMLSATRIRVLKADTQAIAKDLAMLAEKMPHAIKGMAAIIEADAAFDLGLFLKQLKAYGIQPLGVCGPELADLAAKLNLPVLPKDSGKTATATAEAAPVASAAPVAEPAAPQRPLLAPAMKPARIVTEPVRSGQQIYADGSDLIVLSSVSAGAEVIADGCIHIYGHLRGRALAGALGNASARIFARKFEAELVAVGGVFGLTEQIKSAAQGSAAQVLLHDGRLVIEALA